MYVKRLGVQNSTELLIKVIIITCMYGKLPTAIIIHSRVTQTKTIGEKIIDDAYEMSKPLARYVDDEDLEKMLKERIREGDPMLKFMKKKRPTTSVKTTKGAILQVKCQYGYFNNGVS